MVNKIVVTTIFFIVFSLAGCKNSEDLLNEYKDLAPANVINDGSIRKTPETVDVAEHFKLEGPKNDPFNPNDFTFEAGGLILKGRDDVVYHFGIPNQEKQEEWIGGQQVITLEYEFAYFVIDNSSQKIFECEIWSDELAGPRGIRIGDNLSSVISKFYYEDEIRFSEPDTICFMATEEECCALLYQLQPDSLVGLMLVDCKTGDVNKILYGINYGQHCGITWLRFEIVDNKVNTIWFRLG